MLSMKKRNRKEKKQLMKSAPKRDDINIRPKYALVNEIKRRYAYCICLSYRFKLFFLERVKVARRRFLAVKTANRKVCLRV